MLHVLSIIFRIIECEQVGSNQIKMLLIVDRPKRRERD